MILNYTRVSTVFFLILFVNCFTQKSFAQFNNATLTEIDPEKDVIDNGPRGGTSFLTPMYYQLIQSKSGIVYIRNSVSVVAGNGNQWIEFYTENTDVIRDMALDSSQNLVVLLEHNVGIFKVTNEGHRFQSLLQESVEDELISIFIHENELYVVSKSDIYVVRDKKLISIEINAISGFLFEGPSGLLQVDPERGIYNLDGSQLVNFSPATQISIVEPFATNYVLAGKKPGIFLWNGTGKLQEPIISDIEGITCIRILEDKWIVIGTKSHGLYIISEAGEVLLHYTEEDGLPSNMITDLLEDHENGLWIATDNGIVRFEYRSPIVKVFDQNAHGIILSLEGFNDRLYVGSTKGLFVSQPNFKQFDPIEGPEGFIYSIKTLGESLLIGSGAGMYLLSQDDQFELIRNIRVRAITVTPSINKIFVGFNNGIEVFQYENINIGYVGTLPGITDDIRSLVYDSVNDILVAASIDPKVIRISQPGVLNRVEILDTLNGLHDNVQVFVDDGRVVFGGQEGILSFNESSQRFEYDSSYGAHFISNFDAYRFLKDEEGNAWISSNGIVERLFATPSGYVQDSTTFLDLPSSTYRAMYVDKNGTGWMGGDDGLFRMDPTIKKTPPKGFTAVISDIVLKNDSLRSFNGISGAYIEGDLSHELNDFIFRYAAPTFNKNANVKYSYVLEGYDKKWSDWTKETYKEYTNLSRGDYTFKVKALSLFGESTMASVDFRILPAWYATIWAWMVYLLAFFGVGYILFGMQRRRMMAKLRTRLKAKQGEVDRQKEISEKLLQMDRLKDDFLANTSHELRTPLNGIIGISESLMDNDVPPDSEELRENLALVVASGKRLSSLVDGILDYSKLKTKSLDLIKKPVDLSSVAEVVVAMSRPLTTGHPVVIENKISSDLPLIWGDENRLLQVLYNLVGNAIKFTEEGSISIRAKETKGEVEVCVQDTGIGIDPDRLDSIFDSYESQDQSINRDYIGTGLGLTITKKLVELHKGQIWVSSIPGTGSSFYFTVPISPDQVEPVTRARVNVETRVPSPRAQPQKGKFNIMIVDDEPINQQVLANILNAKGFGITLASSGKKALELIEMNKPDMVLLDIMMPKMSGFEVCERIRTKYLMSELPVIFITAKNQIKDLVEGFSYGANDYVTKPISKDEFLARVNTHLNLHKLNESYARFVPHEFLKLLKRESILDVELGQQVEKQITLLFSDIRSYTTISEGMSPKENFEFLNKYLKKVGPAIRENSGFISQYYGDGILALFPSQPEDALKTALKMVLLVREFNQETSKQGREKIRVGIGLHAGMSMLGILGDEMRMDASVVSDSVNIASRMEGLTKFYSASIIMSESTLDLIDNKDDYDHRFLGKVVVKGKSKSTNVIEVFQADEEPIRLLKLETKEDFEQGLQTYFAKNFTEAAGLFNSVIERNPNDAAASHYLKNSADYMVTGVAEEWEGVESLDFK